MKTNSNKFPKKINLIASWYNNIELELACSPITRAITAITPCSASDLKIINTQIKLF